MRINWGCFGSPVKWEIESINWVCLGAHWQRHKKVALIFTFPS